MKKCSKCGVEKSDRDFSIARRCRSGLQSSCKACNKEYREKNRDKIINYHRKLRSDNVDLSRKRSRDYAARNPLLAKVTAANLKSTSDKITLLGVKNLFDSHGWCCYYCGTQSASTTEMTLDHVIPFAAGGRNVIQNCVPACASCNSSKSDRTEREFNDFLNTKGAEV